MAIDLKKWAECCKLEGIPYIVSLANPNYERVLARYNSIEPPDCHDNGWTELAWKQVLQRHNLHFVHDEEQFSSLHMEYRNELAELQQSIEKKRQEYLQLKQNKYKFHN